LKNYQKFSATKYTHYLSHLGAEPGLSQVRNFISYVIVKPPPGHLPVIHETVPV